MLPLAISKSPGFVPAMENAMDPTGAPPVLVTVTDMDVEVLPVAVVGKLRLVGLNESAPGVRPVPSSVAVRLPACVLA